MCFFQPAITCPKLMIETLEQGVKYGRLSGVFIVNYGIGRWKNRKLR